MKKLIFVFAIGQFVLALISSILLVDFYKATENAAEVEAQLSRNCTALKESLAKAKISYEQANRIIDNLSAQLPRIGDGLIRFGRKINGVLPGEPGNPIVETGFTCHDTSKLLKNYNSQVAPGIQNVLTETANSSEMANSIFKERKPYSKVSHNTLLLGAAIVAICLLNGTALIVFAINKNY